ncbi:MAG: hypothetical protein GX580_10980 [Candidatus Hydrogenedens sp.]|nr:hypothetical protein [Candidatus Hydrogenedentota bacterium]NLF58151.1 hypothetical protein [Candidatus Hydrogenedens sp.]
MAIRLGEHVIWGHLRNIRKNSTHGSLCLKGEKGEEPFLLHFELTGNCDPDLSGKVVRFFCAGNPEELPPFDRSSLSGFQERQIGPTGTMTAQDWVRLMPCGVEEFIHRAKLGEPPPTRWVRRLYLEWHGQNGRVVVEMADPLVEWFPEDGKDEDKNEFWHLLPNLAPMPECAMRDAPLPDLEIFRVEAGEDPQAGHWSRTELNHSRNENAERPHYELDGEYPGEDFWDDDDECSPVDYEAMAETALVDECLEKEGVPLAELLGGLKGLPRGRTLRDDEAEAHLKPLLARLAMLNIAFDICEHFTPRAAYRVLTEHVLRRERGHPEMIGSGWVQHYCTHDYCRKCQDALNDMPF